MILKNGDFDEFAFNIHSNKKNIVFFGAGTILTTWMPYICRTYDLYDSILCCIDNNREKINQNVRIGEREVLIQAIETLLNYNAEDLVFLITSSYFGNIVEQLDSFLEFEVVQCYIAPIMHITHYKDSEMDAITNEARLKIPKVIHYCWFGGEAIPEQNLKCIESWKKHCPDYEIVRWDEHNYDISKNKYMKQAYENRRWGFVPDYARIDILYHYGGIYFDTDVELLRKPTELMTLGGFCSFEEWPDVNFGSGSGAVKGNSVLKSILDFRNNVDFVRQDGTFDLRSCGYFETNPLVELGLKLDGTLQKIKDFTILPSDYFNSLSSITGQNNVNDHTIGIHYMNWSWVSTERLHERQKTKQNYDRILNRIAQGGKKDE